MASKPAPTKRKASLTRQAFEAGQRHTLLDLAGRLPEAIVALTRARIASGEIGRWTTAERARITSVGILGDEADTALVAAVSVELANQLRDLLRAKTAG